MGLAFIAVVFIVLVSAVFSLMAASVLAFIVGSIGLLALAGITFTGAQHDARMKAKRKQLSICDFARDFDKRSIDPWVIRFVYEEITDMTGYPIRAVDHIYKDLRLNEDDIYLDLAGQVARRLDRDLIRLPPNAAPVETVEDIVNLLNALPKTPDTTPR